MLNSEKNQDNGANLDPVHIPANLLGEFLQERKDTELLQGLDAMFREYFATHRYFDNHAQNQTDAVLEAYHFCRYFLTHKELFNPKNVA